MIIKLKTAFFSNTLLSSVLLPTFCNDYEECFVLSNGLKQQRRKRQDKMLWPLCEALSDKLWSNVSVYTLETFVVVVVLPIKYVHGVVCV